MVWFSYVFQMILRWVIAWTCPCFTISFMDGFYSSYLFRCPYMVLYVLSVLVLKSAASLIPPYHLFRNACSILTNFSSILIMDSNSFEPHFPYLLLFKVKVSFHSKKMLCQAIDEKPKYSYYCNVEL